VFRRSSLTALSTVIAAAALHLIACGPQDDLPISHLDDPNAITPAAHQCGSDMPSCVAACGMEADGVEPYCRDGRWYCEDGVPDTTCPDYGFFCDTASPCAGGYTCVHSMSHPIPADAGICRKGEVARDYDLESCSDLGAMSAKEFLGERDTLVGQIVKITGTVGVDVKCSKNACGEDACCNTCVGNYVIHMRDPDDAGQKTSLTIETETVACTGSTCDLGCAPLTVGNSYMVWGLLEDCQGQSSCNVLYMGGCPL